jgi:glucan phosphoethanolaminetransferase (alkaline phosphatase superfamily)
MRFLLQFIKWLSLIGLLLFVLAVVRLFISNDPFAAKLIAAFGTIFGYLLVPCALILSFVASTRKLKSSSNDVSNTDPATGLTTMWRV